MSKKVAEIIVDTLAAAGVKHCYGIVGDTLNLIAHHINESDIEWVHVRHEEVGGFAYTPEEKQFAEEVQKSLPPGEGKKLESTAAVLPLGARTGQASTDAGDVSWNIPTIGFRAATFVPGVVAHTWQAAATSGMTIGQKGMVVAAKALAITGADLFADAQLIWQHLSLDIERDAISTIGFETPEGFTGRIGLQTSSEEFLRAMGTRQSPAMETNS